MTNSVIDNVWMQHTKVGAWMDGPMDNFTIRNSRILDQTADGVNFHTGVTNSTVTNTFVRNTGDDALAMWAQDVPNVNNSFTRNTIGVHAARQPPGQLRRPGHHDHATTWWPTRSPTAAASTSPTATRASTGATARRRHLDGRPQHADPGRQLRLQLELRRRRDLVLRAQRAVRRRDHQHHRHRHPGQLVRGAALDRGRRPRGINFNNVRIDGAGTYALQVQAPSQVSFTNVTATGIAQANPIHNCVGTGFQITQGAAATPAGTRRRRTAARGRPRSGTTGRATRRPRLRPPRRRQLDRRPEQRHVRHAERQHAPARRATVTIRNTGTAAAPISAVSTERRLRADQQLPVVARGQRHAARPT